MLAKPSDYLSAAEVRGLRRKSDLVGALLVLHAWGLILGAMAVYALIYTVLPLTVAVLRFRRMSL